MYELCGVTWLHWTQAKYLGVILSADLQWHSQVCAVAKKANTTLHFISKILCEAVLPQVIQCNCIHVNRQGWHGILCRDMGPLQATGQEHPGEGHSMSCTCVLQQDLAQSQRQPDLPVAVPWLGIIRDKAILPTHGAHVQDHT